LIRYEQSNDQAAAYANRKSNNIQQGEYQVVPQVPDGDSKIVTNHDALFF
jgi:hypothetical protein